MDEASVISSMKRRLMAIAAVLSAVNYRDAGAVWRGILH
jgi:hypothetical protein